MGSAAVRRVPRSSCLAVVAVVGTALAASAPPPALETVALRGRPQTLHLYGSRGADPVIFSSGDGGWVHLGPHVAETLAAHGLFVVGFDVRAYLESFTSGATPLRAADVAADYDTLATFAGPRGSKKPILIGVSAGAGLSVLAATDRHTQSALDGVIALGLPDLTELAWRWRDAVIYLTHGVPNEPTFSAAAIVDRVAPLPLVAIHSARDEFVPLTEVERVMSHAREPKQLWILQAANHRFSDALPTLDARLLDAIAWVRQRAPR